MRKTLTVLLIAATVAFSSCTTRNSISITADGAGTCTFSVSFHPAVMAYLSDFALGMGMDGSGLSDFVDEGRLNEQIGQWQGVESVSLVEDPDDELTVLLNLSDFDAFVHSLSADDGIPGFFNYNYGAESSLTIRLDPWIVHRIITIAAPEGNAFIDVFGPQPQNPYSRSEYKEIVEYAFEDYLSDEAPIDMLAFADMEVTVNVPGRISSVLGGEQLNRSSARFTVPFIDIVTLERVIEWTVVYQ